MKRLDHGPVARAACARSTGDESEVPVKPSELSSNCWSIDGTMAFDRKDYGMNKSIPFIKIANRVEVNVSLKWKRVSGASPVFQQ
jgi:hypothetical protein